MEKRCNYKIWIIITMVVLVAGMVMLGVLGLNQSADYASSYEVRVSVDQDVNGSGDAVKAAADKFFADKGIKVNGSEIQVLDDNSTFVYKFSEEPKIEIKDLKEALSSALKTKTETANLVADAEGVYPVNVTYYREISGMAITLGVAAIAIFLYLLIVEKPAAAFAAIVSSVVSALLFISIISIARVPAYPLFAAATTFAVALTAILSAVTVNGFNEVYKIAGNEKLSPAAVAEKVSKKGAKRLIFTACVAIVAAIPFVAFGSLVIKFAAIEVAIAVVTATFASAFWTPFMWSIVKKRK